MRFIIITILSLFIILGCTSNSQNPSKSPVEFSEDELLRRTFNYFWELTDTLNWQVPDRWPNLTFSSIAATGFGLSSYLVGVERGYITREQAAERVLRTLNVLWELPQGPDSVGVSGYKGFFYHFLTLDKALRYKKVELSSIDTGLLMAGVLSALTYFDKDNPRETEIRKLADALYRRVEWDWMLNERGKLSMGWHPEYGFIENDWHGYNEAMILIIMAMGSPTHPIPEESWEKWCETYDWGTFYGQENVQFDPLFGHQYSHVWIDFRGIQDSYMQEKGIDYFENSRRATLSNRAYCIENPKGFKGYSENLWGLTACDGPANQKSLFNGKEIQFYTYHARGAAGTQIIDDGTIAPTAAGGSVPFEPELCLSALKYMWETYYDELITDYGFRDAFNLSFQTGENDKGWFGPDHLGIDQGPILLMIENHRTGFLWELMKKNPYIVAGLKKAGFRNGWIESTE